MVARASHYERDTERPTLYHPPVELPVEQSHVGLVSPSFSKRSVKQLKLDVLRPFV